MNKDIAVFLLSLFAIFCIVAEWVKLVRYLRKTPWKNKGERC